MIRTLVIAALFGLLATAAAAQSLDKGKEVFTANKCQGCHSINGVGNKKGVLDDVGARLSEEEIRSWIVSAPEMATKKNASRKPAMKAYANLSKDDLDALVAYLRSLKAKS